MHYYPEDTSYNSLKKICMNNVCAECGRQLSRYLDRESGKVYVACSGQKHEGITREYKPPEKDGNTELRREMELEQSIGVDKAHELATIPKQGQLTQPQAEKILGLAYPGASNDDIIRCAIFCRDFGLHPLANEVFLIPFKGKHVMVVGIPANRKMAHNLKGEFSFLDDSPRAATEEEIIKQFGKDSEEAERFVISVTKLKGESGNLAIGFGLWPKLRVKMVWSDSAKKMVPAKKDGETVMESNEPHGTDKGNSKRNMSNIHSERQAMDRLPGRAMPKVEVIDTTYADIPDVGKVDIGGDYDDGSTVTVIVEEPKPAPKKALKPAAKAKAPAEEAEQVLHQEEEVKDTQADELPEEAPKTETKASPIDMEWLSEQLYILQASKLASWTNAAVVKDLTAITGKEADSVTTAVAGLSREQAKLFVEKVKSTVELT